MSHKALMDKSLDGLIVALCADFERRRISLDEKSLPTKVLMEYKFLNLHILEGVIEIVGVKDARLFINEIGARRGYAKTEIDGMSESIYKQKKAKAKINIAIKLSLI